MGRAASPNLTSPGQTTDRRRSESSRTGQRHYHVSSALGGGAYVLQTGSGERRYASLVKLPREHHTATIGFPLWWCWIAARVQTPPAPAPSLLCRCIFSHE